MTIFESIVHIDRPINEIYHFLSDINHHQQLMPPTIQDWRSTADEATFSIQNMARLRVVVNKRVENSEVEIITTDNPPFKAIFRWQLAQEVSYTSVSFVITAELNMMMKMLASGPLQKLANHETQTLASILTPPISS